MKIYKMMILIYSLGLIFVLPVNASIIGYSGMTQIDNESYLVVHDKKGHQDGIRVAILKIRKDDTPLYSPVIINDWKHIDGRPSDLESVCSIPHRKNEFLLAESGYWEGKFGRIFHIKLFNNTASVLNVYQLPLIKGSSRKDPEGDNFEGMICVAKQKTLFVIIGERGGNKIYRNGLLRIGVLDSDDASISWNKYSSHPIEITAPGIWNNPDEKRSISDLFLDKNNVIWAVATQDKGDQGPFKSIIYKAAIVSKEKEIAPLFAIPHTQPSWTIDGFKVESLSGPTPLIKGSFMSIGTEDESYDGNWRPLFSPTR